MADIARLAAGVGGALANEYGGYYLFRGESPGADRLVKRLEARKDLSPAMKKAVADFRGWIDREREYMARALPLFRKSVATAERPANILASLPG